MVYPNKNAKCSNEFLKECKLFFSMIISHILTDNGGEFKNKEFPKFDLNTLMDKNFNSEQLKGKPTMINFWFTRCAPCIDEMPVLNKIKEKYTYLSIVVLYLGVKGLRYQSQL